MTRHRPYILYIHKKPTEYRFFFLIPVTCRLKDTSESMYVTVRGTL